MFAVCGCTFMCFCIIRFDTFGFSFSWVSFWDSSAFLLMYLLSLVNSVDVYLVEQLKIVGVAQNLKIMQNVVGIKNAKDVSVAMAMYSGHMYLLYRSFVFSLMRVGSERNAEMVVLPFGL